MSQRVHLVNEASAELEDAARWYEQRHAGLGLAFVAAVDRAVESIVRWPQAGVPIDGLAPDLDVRRVPVSRFPYYLAYLVSDDEIHVLAMAGGRSDAEAWSVGSPGSSWSSPTMT